MNRYPILSEAIKAALRRRILYRKARERIIDYMVEDFDRMMMEQLASVEKNEGTMSA